MTKDQYIILFEKYQLGICTPEEIELLKKYSDEFELQHLPWQNEMGDEAQTEKSIYAAIEKDMQQKQKAIVKPMFTKRLMIAAAVLFFIAISSYLFISNKKIQKPTIAQQLSQQKNDVTPGGNKAVLTLANGSTIILDSAHNGLIAQDGNANISKLSDGKLSYNAAATSANNIAYNLLSTPRGGQFQLTLPDGSQVWLNAASSIRYPTAFTGKERDVELTGEAYFEVAKNASMPFKVKVNGTTVEVLGTHFNINAYNDEPTMKTTLLKGAVKINSSNGSGVLNPGQQAQINNNASLKIISDVDVDEVVAWKNGYISFTSADIKTIMRQISRWYDVDVVYDGNIAPRNFTGEISRSSNLSEMLKILQASNIHFKLEDKKLIVTQ